MPYFRVIISECQTIEVYQADILKDVVKKVNEELKEDNESSTGEMKDQGYIRELISIQEIKEK